MSTSNQRPSNTASSATPAAVKDFIHAQRNDLFAELAKLVALYTVHGETDTAADRQQAVDLLVASIDELNMGFVTKTFDTSDGSTAIVAHRAPKNNQPTVLLYCHYDVVPVPDRDAWISDPLELTERDGRWYGRGAADCKGNVVAHFAALRALHHFGDTGVGITLLIEGSEERGGEGLHDLIHEQPELVAADAIMIVDTGGVAVGVPTLTTSLRGGALVDVTVNTMQHAVHSGSFGGAAPDAVAALMQSLATLKDPATGATTIDGVDCSGRWTGAPYNKETFAADAGVLDGVAVLGGDDATPADLVWARPAVTVIGFTSTPVEDAVNAVPHTASARLNLRVPAGMDAQATAEALKAHVARHIPWGAQAEVTIVDVNPPFQGTTEGPVAEILSTAMSQAFDDKETVAIGSGGSIPLTTALQELHPNAAIALYGVEEPQCAIHSANESVSPAEIESIATAEALFLLRYGSQD
ncbi:M20/M25/M40 family metallo-hydrolase [Corynebacterium choanae]|uniref:Putative succinyl-diaminopimelate desuccinylase n=1 Tax=Corynebacterium choanae TaxID=1862358 RepID=A0A3G6J453_9CORY|nr:M20/M25/M40 family metallo-hydrolase [Corynebacterium choanae]AZA12726.1 putative succinyl-diaminopimelate desuccinylase [Corynebacterium choanae]